MDGGTPPLTSTAVVSINVIRNLFAPSFLTKDVQVTIKDNSAPGLNITKLQAIDNDRAVSIHNDHTNMPTTLMMG